MKVIKIKIEKFRAIKFSEIELHQETALVGQNSAGKSSILRALNAFFNFKDEKQAFLEGRHAFQKTTQAVITVYFANAPASCDLPRTTSGRTEIQARLKYKRVEKWEIYNNGKWSLAPTDLHQKLSKHVRYVYVPMRRDHEVSGWKETSLLKSAVEAWLNNHTKNRDMISPKVSKISHTIKKQAFEGLSKKIREMTPLEGNFSYTLEYDPAPSYALFLRDLVLRVTEGDTTVDLQDCGSGTQSMTAIGLYSYLAEQENSTYFLGIEEPEQNLHPHAQRQLLQNLRKMPLQVLFTTHSTVMVDELEHEEIVLCRRIKSPSRSIEIITSQIKNDFWEKNNLKRDKYYSFYRQRNSDFFFANHITVVESPIDGDVIKYFLRQEHVDHINYSISVLSINGVRSLDYVFLLFDELDMNFTVIVDKDYFLPYQNDSRASSLDSRGFPKYRCEFKTDCIISKIIPDPTKRNDFLVKFHSNETKSMEFLAAQGVYCFRWALEIDLVNSAFAQDLIYDQLNLCPSEKNVTHLLTKCSTKIKSREIILSVLEKLPRTNYPHSFSRIRRMLPKAIRKIS